LIVLALAAPVLRTHAESRPGIINIVQPEKSVKHRPARKHKRPRGSSNPVYPIALPPPLTYTPPRSQQVISPTVVTPPPIVVPQTGRVLPNLPAVGSGPGGTETGQDRAMRCAHQAGIYGQAAGDRGAYIGSCINQ
jgi:hypothetical protein